MTFSFLPAELGDALNCYGLRILRYGGDPKSRTCLRFDGEGRLRMRSVVDPSFRSQYSGHVLSDSLRAVGCFIFRIFDVRIRCFSASHNILIFFWFGCSLMHRLKDT